MPRVAKQAEVEKPVVERKPRASKVVEAEPAATKTRRTRTKREKDPDAPKKPLNAYMLFAADYRTKHADELAKVGPVTEQGKHMGNMYRSLKPADAEKWKALAAKGKAKYEKELEAYTASH